MSVEAMNLVVRKSITVDAPPDRSFAMFTQGMSSWWPLDSHHIGAEAATAVVMEPKAGGRWFERAANGDECDWGRVLVWEPPHRLVLAWQISAEWQYAPTVRAEVEVRFTAVEGGRTSVELEHRGLETYGERAGDMAEAFGSPGGWAGLLEQFAGSLAS